MGVLVTFFKGVRYGRYDKTVHFSVSFLLTLILLLLWRSTGMLVVVAFLGLVKEMRDMFREGDHFDWYDITANIAGILCAYMFWRSIQYIQS